jgi:hypothetical protein
MNYKSFTQKNKIQNSELVNGQQVNAIDLSKWTKDVINKRLLNTQPIGQNISGTNSWDTAWEDMDTILSGPIVLAIYKTWNINFGEINYKWINKFDVEMIFRNGVLGNGNSNGFQVSANQYFKKFIGWDIKDLISNPTSDIKTVNLIASLFCYNTLTIPVFQSKLLVKYIDQTNRD